MTERRASRRGLRVALLALSAAAVAAAALQAPRALRRLEAFRVETVRVTGTRYLQPYAVVAAAGLTRTSSVFDPARAWEAGVLTLPLVEDVRARRELPSTVVLEIVEVEPFALVGAERLRPVDVTGRVLELEPAGKVLDLPVITGAEVREGRVVERGAHAVAALAALRVRAPALAEAVSQVEVGPHGLRLVFRDAGADALLPVAPTPAQLTQLRLTFADLAARGELARVRRLDVRFRDQVVVSFLGHSVSS